MLYGSTWKKLFLAQMLLSRGRTRREDPEGLCLGNAGLGEPGVCAPSRTRTAEQPGMQSGTVMSGSEPTV